MAIDKCYKAGPFFFLEESVIKYLLALCWLYNIPFINHNNLFNQALATRHLICF